MYQSYTNRIIDLKIIPDAKMLPLFQVSCAYIKNTGGDNHDKGDARKNTL